MKPNFTRSDFVRQRRGSRSTKDKRTAPVGARRETHSYTSASVLVPLEPRPLPRRTSQPGRGRPGAGRGAAHDIAFNVGRTSVRAPSVSFSLPELGPRWISAVLAAVMLFLMYTCWNSQAFTIQGASLTGAERLTAAEIDAAIGLTGEPIFKAVPEEITTNLRSAFPELASVRVRVGFPSRLRVDVVERVPVLAWENNDVTVLVDGNGVAFLPRGDASGLIAVQAEGSPPPVEVPADVPLFERPYLDPAMVQAIQILAPYVPAGTPMSYDPTYGMGWQDPGGWFVYFGQNIQDIPMKLVVYQSIARRLPQQGIQPTLVSVEFLDAPFYK